MSEVGLVAMYMSTVVCPVRIPDPTLYLIGTAVTRCDIITNLGYGRQVQTRVFVYIIVCPGNTSCQMSIAQLETLAFGSLCMLC